MVLLSPNLSFLFGEPKNLGNKLHSHYIYESHDSIRIKANKLINKFLKIQDPNTLLELGFDEESRELLTELIKLRTEKNWKICIIQYLESLNELILREIHYNEKIPIILEDLSDIKSELVDMPIFSSSDQVTISKRGTHLLFVDYTCLGKNKEGIPYSPSYNGKFESWRDTQFKILCNFEKKLFVWKYINVHREHRGQGIGTDIITFMENIGVKWGFKRFSVEWPNQNFWSKHFNYEIKPKWVFETPFKYYYCLEGYKKF